MKNGIKKNQLILNEHSKIVLMNFLFLNDFTKILICERKHPKIRLVFQAVLSFSHYFSKSQPIFYFRKRTFPWFFSFDLVLQPTVPIVQQLSIWAYHFNQEHHKEQIWAVRFSFRVSWFSRNFIVRMCWLCRRCFFWRLGWWQGGFGFRWLGLGCDGSLIVNL